MAIDEALLEFARQEDTPILRFYTWAPPTLSLGYFQRYADRKQHPASQNLDVVRRLSGGGAIVHDHELTYSLAIPPNHHFAVRRRLKLYEVVHRHAIEILQNWGFQAKLASEVPGLTALSNSLQSGKTGQDHFLCFQRLAAGDLVVQSKEEKWVKILGSAQYRDQHGAVLQHGSLLWQRSAAAPELPGLADLGRPLPETVSTQDNLRCHELLQNALAAKIFDTFEQSCERFSDEKKKKVLDNAMKIEKIRSALEWIRKK